MAGSTWRQRRTSLRANAERTDATEMVSAASRTSAYATTAFSVPDAPPSPFPSSGSATFGDPAVDDAGQAGTSPAGSDQYQAWAERLRQKRVDAQRVISGADEPTSTNWSTQSVFTESQRIVDNDVAAAHRDPVGVSAAYAVLSLDIGAGLHQVDARYRQLAKEHHPDRFVGDDAEVQRSHAEQFRAICTAREVLRQALGTV